MTLFQVIVKSAKSAVKSRTVDVEAIQKFREKLEELEPKIKKIIVMENEEAAFRAAENQINRTQNKLDGTHQKRDWYQVKFLTVVQTQAISLLKSISERDGSDIERL